LSTARLAMRKRTELEKKILCLKIKLKEKKKEEKEKKGKHPENAWPMLSPYENSQSRNHI